MNQLLGDLVDVCALVYLDDILIFSCTKEEHQKHVYMVFEGLPSSSIMLSARSVRTVFRKGLSFLVKLSWLLVLLLFRPKVDTIKKWLQPHIYQGYTGFFRILANYYAVVCKGLCLHIGIDCHTINQLDL